MPTLKVEQNSAFLCNAVFDEDAIPTAELFVERLQSDWLSGVVLHKAHIRGAETSILEHINLVLTIEGLSAGHLRGFLFAELEPSHNVARLHVLYTLRRYRKQGVAISLLSVFDNLMHRAEFKKVCCVPTSLTSLRLLRKHSANSALHYELHEIPEEDLLAGEQALPSA